jgi:hypothetical protein
LLKHRKLCLLVEAIPGGAAVGGLQSVDCTVAGRSLSAMVKERLPEGVEDLVQGRSNGIDTQREPGIFRWFGTMRSRNPSAGGHLQGQTKSRFRISVLRVTAKVLCWAGLGFAPSLRVRIPSMKHTSSLRALALAALLFTASVLHAQVPQLINYQGRIVVGATNFSGSGSFAFALVSTTGSTTYWSNDGTSTAGSQPTNAVSLTVTNGLYSVLLGDATLTNMTAIPASVFGNADVRLRVWFNDGTHGFQLLSPDQRIAAVGYAMMAGTLQSGANITAGTVTATNFIGNGSGLTGTGSYNPLQVALLKWGPNLNSANNTITVGGQPIGVCFDGANIWVGNNNAVKLSAATGATLAAYSAAHGINYICFDGLNIWGSNGSSFASKLSASTGAVIGAYNTQLFGVNGMCFDGTSIWAFSNIALSGNVAKLNAATGAVTASYTVGGSVSFISGICFDGTNIWVAIGNFNSVTALNASTGTVVGIYAVGSFPQGICFDGTNIWVANANSANVTKLNAKTGAVVGTYAAGTNPGGICFDGVNIWVTNNNSVSNNVTELNAGTGAVIGTYTGGSYPSGICFDGANIWVVSTSGGTVTKL